ncbi:helix-turn-helix domain-containing protein [Nocardioides sp. SYSU DS0663]|uniref:helix-turn-helix domain-containing protein n=1 Tax=Nocardioides sp. SYSU DS0663 TaxID=3416445 RepID=UPI003F4BD2E7
MGDDQQKDAAAKAGLDQSAISRWLRTGTPGRAENVAAFARAYNRPVLEAFVAAEFLTAQEAKQRPTAAPTLDSLSDDQLVEEIRTRLKQGGEHGGDTAATSKAGARLPGLDEAREARRRQLQADALPEGYAAYDEDDSDTGDDEPVDHP